MMVKIIAMEELGICKYNYCFWSKRTVERNAVI